MSREIPSRWTLFETIRDEKFPSLLFIVTRDHDEVIYLYNARRIDNILMEPYVDVTSCELKHLEIQSRVSDLLLNNFLGMRISQEGKTYDAILHAFSDRKLKLKLKAVKSRVTASYTTRTSWPNFGKNEQLEIENAEIYNVHTPITFNILGVPDLAFINVYSRIVFQDVVNAFQKKNIKKIEMESKPTSIFYINETIVVTPEMKAKYNITDLFKMFTESVKKD